MHTPQRRQKRKRKTQQNAQLTKHDSFLYRSSSSSVCWLSTFRKLGTCSTSEALSPRTVLTENICQTVQQILQHCPAIIPFLTTSTLTNPPMHTPKATKSETLNSPNMTPSITCPLPVQCVGGRLSGSLADALQNWSTSEVFSPRTMLTENICRCVQQIQKNGSATMAFLTTPQ